MRFIEIPIYNPKKLLNKLKRMDYKITSKMTGYLKNTINELIRYYGAVGRCKMLYISNLKGNEPELRKVWDRFQVKWEEFETMGKDLRHFMEYLQELGYVFNLSPLSVPNPNLKQIESGLISAIEMKKAEIKRILSVLCDFHSYVQQLIRSLIVHPLISNEDEWSRKLFDILGRVRKNYTKSRNLLEYHVAYLSESQNNIKRLFEKV